MIDHLFLFENYTKQKIRHRAHVGEVIVGEVILYYAVIPIKHWNYMLTLAGLMARDNNLFLCKIQEYPKNLQFIIATLQNHTMALDQNLGPRSVDCVCARNLGNRPPLPIREPGLARGPGT